MRLLMGLGARDCAGKHSRSSVAGSRVHVRLANGIFTMFRVSVAHFKSSPDAVITFEEMDPPLDAASLQTLMAGHSCWAQIQRFAS